MLWFWWGFWFGLIAFIIALTKSDINYSNYSQMGNYNNVNSYANSALSQMAKERQDTEMMRNGGWKCRHCGRIPAVKG